MESEPLGWLWYVFTTAIPYLIGQAVELIAAAVGQHPAGLLLALLVALGLWKLVEAGLWFVRKAWVGLIIATVVGVAITALRGLT